MSLGEDGYDEDHGLTRTRLPEGGDDPYGPRRGGRNGRGGRGARAGMSSRNLVTVVGVVVLLIAAIAFANRGGGSDSGDSDKSGEKVSAGATAPSGVKPVASGFARTEQGAQSAAANFAVALGGDGMFRTESRHAIVDAIHTPDTARDLQAKLDKAYTADFFKNLGLNDDGTAPKGQTFVSRTIPVGTKATSFNENETTVEVWCTGLVGLAGEGSTKPVAQTWFTITQKLRWTDGDWKLTSSEQKQGPAPVSGDIRASSADEITNAVKGYGGFTYAR
ncbi:hypothetical protein [Streptomyces sp. NPDC008001]|uniref:hypothetical protein n=1 Tax=Streptomyces sp. NPDC008001 TaxID=3364804 RepID=UPI0036EF600A